MMLVCNVIRYYIYTYLTYINVLYHIIRMLYITYLL